MGLLETLLFIPPLYRDHISIKSLTYVGKDIAPSFTYHDQGLPIKSNMLLIKVVTAALNPMDIQLMNTPLSISAAGNKGVGRDFCGIIEEVGKDHKGTWNVGDKVCGMFIHPSGQGTVSSYVIIDPSVDRIIKAPPNLTDEEAAAFPLVLGMALKSMAHAKLDANSWVCILGGASCVGQLAIQLAKNLFHVNKVVVTCSQSSSVFCKGLGADVTIDYRAAANVGDSLLYVLGHKSIESNDLVASQNTNQVSANNAKRFQLILDCAGGTDVVYKAAQLLQPTTSGSAYVTIVGDEKTTPAKANQPSSSYFSPAMLGRKVMSATGFLGVNYIVEHAAPGDWLDKAYDLMLERTVSINIDSTYEWNDWKKAVERQSGKHCGKVVLRVTT